MPPRCSPELEGGLSDRLARQFSNELDEAVELGNVILIGATNRPDLVDPAVLRPGRFGHLVHFSLPDVVQRERILQVHLRQVRVDPDVTLADLAREVEGLSGAEIAGLCERAVLSAIEHFVGRHGPASEEKAARGEFVLSAQALHDAVAAVRLRPFNQSLTDPPEATRDAGLP
jgi:transitional endoplasmic reticulum ATPase